MAFWGQGKWHEAFVLELHICSTRPETMTKDLGNTNQFRGTKTPDCLLSLRVLDFSIWGSTITSDHSPGTVRIFIVIVSFDRVLSTTMGPLHTITLCHSAHITLAHCVSWYLGGLTSVWAINSSAAVSKQSLRNTLTNNSHNSHNSCHSTELTQLNIAHWTYVTQLSQCNITQLYTT